MDKNDKEYIKAQLFGMFSSITGSLSDAGLLATTILDDVCTDIEETADPDTWHTGDIQIAATRVLKKQLGIEE